MKKMFIGVSAVLALGLILAACSNVAAPDASSLARKAAVSDITWYGDSDIAVAATLLPTASDRKNASGPKITSNAHSADFDGVYFRWEQKQKDSGYLKVEAWVFEKYDGFVLTKKVSNSYWDYEIKIQPGQEPNPADGCYVFAIPDGKVWVYDGKTVDGIPKKTLQDNKAASGNFNINMVFIPEFKSKDKPVSDIYDDFKPNNKYVISFQKIVKDANGNVIPYSDWESKGIDASKFVFTLKDGDSKIATATPGENGIVTFTVPENKGYTVVEDSVNGYADTEAPVVYPSLQQTSVDLYSRENADGGVFQFDPTNILGHVGYIEGYMGSSFDVLKNASPKPVWIWDRPQSWSFGGNEIIFYHTNVDIPEGATIAPTYFAFSCDNAAVLYVNGVAVAWSKAIEDNVPAYGAGLSDLSKAVIDYDKDPISTVTTTDISEYLKAGQVNTIEFYACNADVTNDPRYTAAEANPGCFIYSGNISYEVGVENEENAPFVNTQLPKERTLGKKYDSTTGTNEGNDPSKFIVSQNGKKLSEHFVYSVLDRAELAAGGVTLTLYNGSGFTPVGTALVQLVGENLVVTIDGKGDFNLLASANNDLTHTAAENRGSNTDTAFIPAPAGTGPIYFYIHLNPVKFYQD